MKSFVIAAVVLCLAVAGGTTLYMNWHGTPPAPGPVVESPPAQIEQASPPTEIAAAKENEPRKFPVKASLPPAMPAANPAPVESKPDNTADAVRQSVDTLISAQTSYADRQAMWKQLKSAGQLEQAITELKQRAAGSPTDAQIPTALGEAYLHKFPIDDYNETAIVGMQVDQSFNTALKIDPSNWEAQYFKADAMSYWPAELNKGPEVIQALSSLIDQQQTLPPQPQFAQTYALLGDQYQKSGQLDAALQIWRQGLALFPNNPALQQKFPRP